MLANVYSDMEAYPAGYSNWAKLGLNLTNSFYEVVITGRDWKLKSKELETYYIPNKLLMGGEKSELTLLQGKFLDETTIFICQHGMCKMPVGEVKDAVLQISAINN